MTSQPTFMDQAHDIINTGLNAVGDAAQWIYSGGKDGAMKVYELALPILKTMGEFLKGHFDKKTSITAVAAILIGATITALFYQLSGNTAPATPDANNANTKKTA